MSDEDLYDEFGNYIGPELDSEEEEEESEEERSVESREVGMQQDEPAYINQDNAEPAAITVQNASAVVLHEDKEYYDQVYGDGVQTVTLTEDAMTIEQPILAPDLTVDDEILYAANVPFVETLMKLNERKRFIALMGDFQSGKSTLLDSLVESSLLSNENLNKSQEAELLVGSFVTDTVSTQNLQSLPTSTKVKSYKSSQAKDRQLTVHTAPLTLPLATHKHKTLLTTLLDTPGHISLIDECECAMSLVDGCVLVVDAVLLHEENLKLKLRRLRSYKLPLILIINKLDRLILELQLPPDDAYFKLLQTLDLVNSCVEEILGVPHYFSPTKRNVCFGSGLHGFVLGIDTIADELQVPIKYLWGNVYYHNKKFTSKKSSGFGTRRSFVQFVLEPVYKLYALVLHGDMDQLQSILLKQFQLNINKKYLKSCTDLVLRRIFRKVFGQFSLVDTFERLPSPRPPQQPLHTNNCNQEEKSLHVKVAKLIEMGNGKFGALARVVSGSLSESCKLKILGQNYSTDEEDFTFCEVNEILVPTIDFESGRSSSLSVRHAYKSLDSVESTNIVVLTGIESNLTGGYVYHLVAPSSSMNANDNQLNTELNVSALTSSINKLNKSEPVIKVSVEPLQPADLPKLVTNLRSILKSCPSAELKVHETGEHALYGTSELHLDLMLQSLRECGANSLEIRVAEPCCALRESVGESNQMPITAYTNNRKNKVSFTVEPLDRGLGAELESGKIDFSNSSKTSSYLRKKYKWDLLSSQSVWAFGPSPTHGGSVLLNDTIPDEVDSKLLSSSKPSIVQGFQWAAKEGPLCEEPIYNVKTKLLDCVFAPQMIHRSSGQLIPTIRRTVHASILLAKPVILEPVYKFEVHCSSSVVTDLAKIFTRRRGYTVGDDVIGGAPMSRILGYVPVVESFGLETDLRLFSRGQAMIYSTFDHWSAVPGDPLDKSSDSLFTPLEPAPVHMLSREFLLKTRRRKGLVEDVSADKYLDREMQELISEMNQDSSRLN